MRALLLLPQDSVQLKRDKAPTATLTAGTECADVTTQGIRPSVVFVKDTVASRTVSRIASCLAFTGRSLPRNQMSTHKDSTLLLHL